MNFWRKILLSHLSIELPKNGLILNKRTKERTLKYKEKLKTKDQLLDEKIKDRLEFEKQRRHEGFEKLKVKRTKEKEERAFANLSSSMHSPIPLYKKFERNYQTTIVMPDLERKKLTLRSIRAMHEPVDHGNLMEHARAYSQKRAEKKNKFKKDSERKMIQQRNELGGRHRSMFLDRVLLDENNEKEQELAKVHELHNLYDKRKNYGNLVKAMHKPIISKRMQVEMEARKATLTNAKKTKMLAPNRSRQHQISELTSVRHALHSPEIDKGNSGYQNYFSDKNSTPVARWGENSMLPKTKPKLKPIVVDYLQEQRNLNEEKYGYDNEYKITKKHRPVKWKSLVEKMDSKDRVNFLWDKAKIIEEKVKFIDELNQNQDFDPDAQLEGDNMLLDALKARMTALEDIAGQI
jgi:hypothetical protein